MYREHYSKSQQSCCTLIKYHLFSCTYSMNTKNVLHGQAKELHLVCLDPENSSNQGRLWERYINNRIDKEMQRKLLNSSLTRMFIKMQQESHCVL